MGQTHIILAFLLVGGVAQVNVVTTTYVDELVGPPTLTANWVDAELITEVGGKVADRLVTGIPERNKLQRESNNEIAGHATRKLNELMRIARRIREGQVSQSQTDLESVFQNPGCIPELIQLINLHPEKEVREYLLELFYFRQLELVVDQMVMGWGADMMVYGRVKSTDRFIQQPSDPNNFIQYLSVHKSTLIRAAEQGTRGIEIFWTHISHEYDHVRKIREMYKSLESHPENVRGFIDIISEVPVGADTASRLRQKCHASWVLEQGGFLRQAKLSHEIAHGNIWSPYQKKGESFDQSFFRILVTAYASQSQYHRGCRAVFYCLSRQPNLSPNELASCENSSLGLIQQIEEEEVWNILQNKK